MKISKSIKADNQKGTFSRLPAEVVHSLKETKERTGLPLQKIISESIKIAEPILRSKAGE
jgi:hypothetical protein